MPANVAGQIEVHEYNNISDEDDEDLFDNDELQPLKKKSKSKSVREKPKLKNVLLSYNQEKEPVRLVEDFPHLPKWKPFGLFSLYFTPDMGSKITTETMRYARLKNNHNFHVK